jgi:hypothetical protein
VRRPIGASTNGWDFGEKQFLRENAVRGQPQSQSQVDENEPAQRQRGIENQVRRSVLSIIQSTGESPGVEQAQWRHEPDRAGRFGTCTSLQPGEP